MAKLKMLTIIIFTVLIFYIIFTRIDAGSVIKILSNVNPLYLLLSILILGVIVLLSVRRWQIILRTTGYSLSFQRSFYILMAAFPLTSITPAKSGDVIKAYYLRDDIPMSKTIGTVLAERMFDLFSLLLISIIGNMFYPQEKILIFMVPIFFLLIILFVISGRNFRIPFIKDSWCDQLQSMMLSIRTIVNNKKTFFTILVISVALWFLAMIQIMLFFYALDINVPFIFAMANVPIAIFVGFVPITLGGMGTRDAMIIMLFAEYAKPDKLLGVGILFSTFRYWILSLIGIPFMRTMIKNE